MPALFDSIQKLVPSHFQIFLWADEHYQVSNMFCFDLPSLAQIAELYLREFVNKREQEAKPPFSEIMRSERGTVNWNRYHNQKFFQSDFYQEILRPLKAHHILATVIHEHNRALGELVLARTPGEAPFTQGDEYILLGLIPYIAHGLRVRTDKQPVFISTGKHGMAILTENGEIEYACPQAHELLFWATHPQISQSTMKDPGWLSVPPALVRLCKNLSELFQGKPAPVPVLHHHNPWGRFTFRAYWLDHREFTQGKRIGMTIEYHEPLILTLFSRMNAYPLSTRQKEICQLLLSDYTHAEIAKRLNISVHTLVDHVRKIYEKLDVHNRQELLKKFSIETGLDAGHAPSRAISQLP
ncbi:MAG TPA: helix-turn-helix transcriptional regulator [Acidiferrobacterales bacterium]|nr:helix-turn-helix transcriptional regulator [Acidiferrobacterales bacterium]